MFESLRRRLIAALLTCAAPAVALCAEPLPRSVLYLDENDPPGVVVSVADLGTGIDPQNSERIFDGKTGAA
jgi:hypothetical protein